MSDTTAHPTSALDRYFGLTENGTNVRTEFIAGADHVPDDGLHRVRQPADPRQRRHGHGRGVRRDLHRGGGVDHGDGALRQLPDRARARHGAQRLLRLHRGARLQVHLAAGARRQCSARACCSSCISVFRIREYIINAIPKNLKLAISAGVGLFLGIIALEEAKIVVAHPVTLVTLGDLKQWPAILCLLGFVLIAALNFRKVIGGTLIGILVVTRHRHCRSGLRKYGGIVSVPPSLAPTLPAARFLARLPRRPSSSSCSASCSSTCSTMPAR